ncbi:MAG: DUF4236 domain-containing protein [Phycisphaeraceae bacterium]
MAFRFFRRVQLVPGLSLNLSKRGGSLSFGPRGAKLTAGTSGVRRTVSLPGTGLWYTEKVGGGKRRSLRRERGSGDSSSNGALPPAPTVRAQDRLTLGFLKRLVTPKGEEHFVDGMRHVVLSDDAKALKHLRQAVHLADAAFMAGMLALKAERYDESAQYLGYARQKHASLGRYFAKYDIDAIVSLPITERIMAHVGPSIRGIMLALAEAHQAMGDWKQAIRDLHQLHQRDPGDMVVTLSLCEILVEEMGDKRALVYEALGQASRTRQELEKLYAEAPNYEDVASRLGMAKT